MSDFGTEYNVNVEQWNVTEVQNFLREHRHCCYEMWRVIWRLYKLWQASADDARVAKLDKATSEAMWARRDEEQRRAKAQAKKMKRDKTSGRYLKRRPA